jgi:hypothetical protein
MAALGGGLAISLLLLLAAGWLERPPTDLLPVATGGFAALAGGYLAARWAPRRPLRHAVEMGIVLAVFHLFGVFAPLSVALLAITLAGAWLGGRIRAGRS